VGRAEIRPWGPVRALAAATGGMGMALLLFAAVAAMARDYNLPCQVSLEEYMACAVGGCAGCVVEVKTPEGSAMKRVCVDGPVFDATTVFQPNK